jgi:hypothetical protein
VKEQPFPKKQMTRKRTLSHPSSVIQPRSEDDASSKPQVFGEFTQLLPVRQMFVT